MLKLVFCLRRKEHLTRDEFQRYWLEEHAPLVKESADAIGAVGYVQLHTLDTSLNRLLREGRGSDREHDGVAVLWFESVEALADAVASEEGRAAARAMIHDERQFIDLQASTVWLGAEHEIIPPPASKP